MKHEIIELHDVQIIGMAKKIAFNEAKEECPKFWGEYVEKIIRPVFFEKQEPNAFQKAAIDNGVGEFGLCTCDIPNHNCAIPSTAALPPAQYVQAVSAYHFTINIHC